ncbi:MAG: TPM domain-containing protein [Galactobacillus timonensis]|uniref:TPM domain-containing protein n=1 Tax=Galactobacillus timonensis TaxID=2041840 RepID=UPI002408F3D4|nr:TPM domain-containing protein [Galactobacillus timonensis]MDD5851017.1 TPM domain-containing protein [Galactobacillus timonensis]MDD6679702.1 TPM domain-containing protein [Galactobacillus timonensis]
MRNTVKHLSILLASILAVSCSLMPAQGEGSYIIDETGVLTSNEQTELEQAASQTAQANEIGMYVIFTDTMHGYSDSDFAEYTYYNYGLGWGKGKSGVLLAIAVEDRYFDSFSYGAATDVFTTSQLDTLNSIVLDYFRDDDWYGGASAFLNRAADIVENSNYTYYEPVYTDPPISDHLVETTPEQRKNLFLSYLPVAAIAAAALAFLINMLRKRSLNNTGLQNSAALYQDKKLDLEVYQDYFMFRNRTVHHMPRNTSSPGGGGSGGYHSSGGMHSSGGSHF